MEGQVRWVEVSDAKRPKALEDENAKLKKLLAEAMLDNAMLKDVAAKKMVTPAAKRKAVAHLRTLFEVSERRAWKILEQTAHQCAIAASELLGLFDFRLLQHGVIPGSSQTKARESALQEHTRPASCGLATMERRQWNTMSDWTCR